MLTTKQYVRNPVCPNCEGKKIVVEDKDFWKEGVSVYKECMTCGATWTEAFEYKLTEYYDLQIPEDLQV